MDGEKTKRLTEPEATDATRPPAMSGTENATPVRRLQQNDDELEQYRSLSATAVLSLISAAVSPMAFLHPAFWGVPLLALILGVHAYRQIAKDEAIVGRTAAVIGACAGATLFAAAAAEWLTFRQSLQAEAARFGQRWFDYLADQAPQKAHALTIAPKHRPGLIRDEVVWEFYRSGPQWRRELDGYLRDRLVRCLLALGHRADIRYHGCEAVARREENWTVVPIFSVSFDDPDGRKSFFVRLTAEKFTKGDQRGGWRLLRAEGGIRPEGVGE